MSGKVTVDMSGDVASDQEYDDAFDSYESSVACSSLQLQVGHSNQCFVNVWCCAMLSMLT